MFAKSWRSPCWPGSQGRLPIRSLELRSRLAVRPLQSRSPRTEPPPTWSTTSTTASPDQSRYQITRLTGYGLPSLGGLLILAAVLVSGCGPGTANSNSSPSPDKNFGSELVAATCPTEAHCIAVGWTRDPGNHRYTSLIEETTGDRWSIVSSPTVPDGQGSQLVDVTCADQFHCLAVGLTLDSASEPSTLIESNSGSGWAIVPSPNPTDSSVGSAARLSGAACWKSSHCIAVGESHSGGFSHALILESTGGAWSISPNPDQSAVDTSLSSVACEGANSCVAVGRSGYQPLLEDWSDSGWSLNPYGQQGAATTGDTPLVHVTCAGTTYCLAVGFMVVPLCCVATALIENAGDGWEFVSGPDSGFGSSYLIGAACISPTECTVVGNEAVPVGDVQPPGTFIWQKTEDGWRNIPRLTDNGHRLGLLGVACSGDHHCMIVGDQRESATSNMTTLIAESGPSGWGLLASP